MTISPRLSLALLAIAATTPPAWATTPIAGRYLTEDGAGIVQVAPCGGATCGRLVRIPKAKPGAPTTDVNNRDPSLRGRPIQGISILSGFSEQGADWRGTIYNPRNGKSYKSIISKNPDGSLKGQGCICLLSDPTMGSDALIATSVSLHDLRLPGLVDILNATLLSRRVDRP